MAAAHQPPRPVPNFAFISSANLPSEGEREGKTDYTFMLHISLSLPFPFPSLFLLPFLTFGKCQRKNCAQNEAQFTARVVCKLSHLQCAPRILLNHPSPLLPSPCNSQFHYDCLFSFFIIIPCLPATFSSYIHKFISFLFLSLSLPCPTLLAPRQSAEACRRVRIRIPRKNCRKFTFTFTISWILTNLHICWSCLFYWVSSLVSIRFLARHGQGQRQGEGRPLKWGVKCH